MDIQPLAPGQTLPPPLGRADVERVAGSRPNRGQNRPTFMMGHRRGSMGGGPELPPVFEAPLTTSGIAYLSQGLDINGTEVQPSFRYEGKDATVSAWPAVVGPDLVIASTGTDPTVDVECPTLASADKAVRPQGGKVWQTAANEPATDITTEDFVFEFFGTPTASNYVCAKFNATGGAVGWFLTGDSGNALKFYLTNGVGSVFVGAATDLNEPWVHLLVFCDRNENSTDGFKAYLNGVLVNSANASAYAASVATSAKFTIGSASNFAAKANDRQSIAYCALWKQSNWFAGGATNATQWEAVARERCSQLAGAMATVTNGSSLVPTTKTRASSGFLDKYNTTLGVRRLFRMFSGWPRICAREETDGTYRRGYLSEYSATNRLNQNNSLSTGATWALTNVNAPTATSQPIVAATNVAAGGTASYQIVPTAANATHYISQNSNAALTAAPHVCSIFAKAGNRNWLQIYNATLGLGATFDLVNGVPGTTTGACTPKIEDWGSGWYRCWIVFTGTAAVHAFQFHSANDTGNAAYAGDGVAVGTEMMLPQLELAAAAYSGAGPTSPVITTTAAATRSPDRLEYTLGNFGTSFTMASIVLGSPDIVDAGTISSKIMGLSATLLGAYTADSINLFVDTSGFEAINWVYAASVQQAKVVGTTSLYDGTAHAVRGNDRTDFVGVKVDGVSEGVPDTSATMPTMTPAYLQVACDQVGSVCQPTHCIISELKVWDSYQ